MTSALGETLPTVVPLVLLIAAIATDRFGLHFRGINLRFELIAAVLLVLFVLVRQGLAPLRRVGPVEWCLAGWLAVLAFSSAVFSPAPKQSLKLTLLVAGMLLLYAVTVSLLRSAQDVLRAAVVWVAVGGVVAIIGIVEAILYVAIDSHVGVAFDGNAQGLLAVITPKITSTLWEANIFGSYMLTVWAVAFALSLSPAFRTRRWKVALRTAMGLSVCGALLSNTRTVWVVGLLLALGMAAVAWRTGLLPVGRQLAGFVNPSLAGLVAGLAIALAMAVGDCPLVTTGSTSGVPAVSQPSGYASAGTPSAQANPLVAPGCVRGGSALLSQLGGLFNPGHVSSFTGRVSINRTALHGWLRRPIFGWGAGAFLYVYGAAAGGWIGNLELHVLFDSGLAGFLFLVVALLLNAWRAGRQLAGGVGAWTPTHFVLFGLVAAGLALLATYQFTEGTWLGFTWVYFGMLAAAGVTAAAEIRLIPAARDGSGNGAVAFRLGWSKTRTPQSPSA